MSKIEYQPESIQPCGDLAKILANFEAGPEVSQEIAKRVGAVMGPCFGATEMEQLIIESLTTQGLPDWTEVIEKVGKIAHKIYEGKNR